MNICGFETTEILYESADTLVCKTKVRDGKPEVILKLLKEGYVSQKKLDQFQQEFEVTQKLQAPNIIKIYGIEKSGPLLALLIEDIHGESLRKWLQREPPSLFEGIKISIQICQGLADIHAGGIIHKAISSSNILWNRKTNLVKITNFGSSTQFQYSITSPGFRL